MIKFEEKPMIDLYEHGNYVGSFETIEQVNDRIRLEMEKLKYHNYTEEILTNLMNKRIYTIIRSSHLKFSDNP